MGGYCFITGFLRSGTTLVEKLVHALPGACIGPQPFPFLYYDTKRAFLRTLGIEQERYPLGHLFLEERYRVGDFERFLLQHRLTTEAVAASFVAMRGYSGWKLPALARHARQVREGSFADVYRGLCDALRRILGRRQARLRGAKEVFCEEFIPYFLAQSVAVILVVRDIRDVVTSLRFGSAERYADPALPLLHIVRQWRKSVSYALQFSGSPGFHVLRYEDVLARPRPALEELALRLGCPAPADDAIEHLRDQDGAPWRGNSSFAPLDGVSPDPVGRFARHLPASWSAAIASLCAPEISALALAAPARAGGVEVGEALQRLASEADLVVGAGRSLAEEVDAERRRAQIIAAGKASEPEQQRWCIFPRAYRRLAGL